MQKSAVGAVWMGSVAVIIVACEPKQRTPEATQGTQIAAPGVSQSPDVAAPTWYTRGQRLLLAAADIGLPPAGLGPGDLPDPDSRGAQVEAKYCAQCHALTAPAAHSATDWPSLVRRMWLRMEWLPESLAVQVPTPAERYDLLQYLTVNALQVSGSALPAGRGREAFALACSRCHALPDPRVHSSEDWPTVVTRMERNMERMKVTPPTGEQRDEILAYVRTMGVEKRAPRSPQ